MFDPFSVSFACVPHGAPMHDMCGATALHSRQMLSSCGVRRSEGASGIILRLQGRVVLAKGGNVDSSLDDILGFSIFRDECSIGFLLIVWGNETRPACRFRLAPSKRMIQFPRVFV